MKKAIDFRQMKYLVVSHSKELLREPAVLFWGIMFPLLMALGLGIAFTQKNDVVRNIAYIKSTNASAENNFLEGRAEKINDNLYRLVIHDKKLGKTTFNFKGMKYNDAVRNLKRGEINIIIENGPGGIIYHFDPVNQEAQLAYLSLSAALKRNPGSNDNVEPFTVTGTRYIDFFVPGLIAMGIMLSSLWGLSYNMIDKRSKKLLRRMIATPMKKSHFLISLITVRTVMSFIEASLLFIFSYFVFNVTIEGSIPALLLLFLSSNIAFAGISLLTSCRTGNTEVGNGLINAIATPMMVLSGIFFSYHNFPDWAISFIKLLPLTILADSMRSIFIEGVGFNETALPIIILASTGIITFTLGLKWFKWH